MISKQEITTTLSGILSQTLTENERRINLEVLFDSRVKDILPEEVFQIIGILRQRGLLLESTSSPYPACFPAEIRNLFRETSTMKGCKPKQYTAEIQRIEEHLLERIVIGETIVPEVRSLTGDDHLTQTCPEIGNTGRGISLYTPNAHNGPLYLPPGRNILFGGYANSYKTPLMASILQANMEYSSLPVFWISAQDTAQQVYTHFYAMHEHRSISKESVPDNQELMRPLPLLTVYGINHFASKSEEHQFKLVLANWLSTHCNQGQVIIAIDGIEEIAHIHSPFKGKRDEIISWFIDFLERITAEYRNRVSIMATYRIPERVHNALQRRIDNYDARLKILGFNFMEVSDNIMDRLNQDVSSEPASVRLQNAQSKYGQDLYRAGARALADADSINAPHGQYGPDAFEHPPELGRFFDLCISIWTDARLKEDNSLLLKIVKNSIGSVMEIPIKRRLIRQGNGSSEYTQFMLNSVEIQELSEKKIILDMFIEDDAL
jgi:hypothetical protein